MGVSAYRWSAWMLGMCLALRCVPAPAALPTTGTGAEIQRLLAQPEQDIDFAVAKLAIDKQIDPATDVPGNLKEIDRWVVLVKSRTPSGLSRKRQMDVLISTLYKPGPWNGNTPFSYDLSDPMGSNRKNKLLSTYLATRKGNCVSMPILVAILGQRLGLHTTLATAPEHLLVKFVDDEDRWINVEATAGGYKFDSSYERETGITSTAIQNEIYLRPLSPREAVGAMTSTLMEHYAAQKDGEALLTVANWALDTNSKDTVAMMHKANASYLLLQARYVSKYPRPMDIPKDKQADFVALSQENLAWFEKAEKLGWSQPTAGKDQNYLQSIEQEKARSQR